MTKVIIDNATQRKLKGLSESLETLDESGHLLGVFTPVRIDVKRLVPRVSQDEIERRLREDERLTTAEVLAHLESL